MIGRIVITSVPQGLDGGTGFQPVLRTQGLKPSVAERLALRAAYPHPFPFGDPRNPRVLFHRIETLADRTIHVLGSVRDAGGSYTGRANRLAELIAIDPAETAALPGGPAFAARGFPWLGRWAGLPRELPLGQEPLIPAVDPYDPQATGRPQRCSAWEKATGDAGWAGELAQSFLDGRRALIWAGEHVDVLELFVEAARLIPASARWRLTFNTCEIEPFPAHWRAVRPELGLVGNYEPKNELRLVLGKIRETGSPAPSHDLARIARGEKPAPSVQPAAEDPHSQQASFGGHASSQSTDPGDAALRARLKEISDERRRRPNAGRAGSDAPRLPGSNSLLAKALLLGSLAFLAGVATVVAFLFVQHPDLINRQLRSRADEDLGLAPARDQPSASGTHAKEPDTVRPDKQGESASVAPQHAPPIAATQQQDQSHSQEDRPTQTATADSTATPTAAQRRAFEALGTNSSWVVPLLDDSSNTSGEELKEVLLHDQFHVVDLIALTIDVASPYDGNYKLSCSVGPESPANTRTWTVTGQMSDQFGEWLPATTVCSVIARDGKLFLKPSINASHELFTRLENSCLLISVGDPRNRVEKYISLRAPVELTPYLLDPLKANPPPLSDALLERLKGIALNRFEWTVELKHRSLSPPRVLTHDKPQSGDLQLANAPVGRIDFEYHSINPDGSFRKTTSSLTLDMTVALLAASGEMEFSVTNDFSDSWPNKNERIMTDQLRALLGNAKNKNDAAWDSLRKRLTSRLQKQADPYSTSLRDELQESHSLRAQLVRAPSQDYNSIKELESRTKEIEGKIKTWDSQKLTQFGEDVDNAIKQLKKHVECFRPIEARITKFGVIAGDKENGPRIPIVKPAAD